MRNLRDQEVYDNELRRQAQSDRLAAAQSDRENSSAAGGVALGIAIASLVGAGLAAYAFFNRQPEAQTPRQTKIIERTKEVVPVPQPKAPDINITVPSPAPANPSPATQSTQSNSAQSNSTQSDSNARSSNLPANGESSQSSPNAAPASENPQ